MPFIVDDATIAAAIIGAEMSVVTTAATLANEQAQQAKGNLAVTIEVFNGTSYSLRPARYLNRHGALVGGIEGKFNEVPGIVEPRQIEVFTVSQVATTDNVGLVVYQSPLFDLLIGWHAYDQGKIWQYLTASLFPAGMALRGAPPSSSDWGADLGEWANKMIWSGLWSGKGRGNQNTSIARDGGDGQAPPTGLQVRGEFVRGVIQMAAPGRPRADDTGAPLIELHRMYGVAEDVAFSSVGMGGGNIMKVYVSDTDRLYNGWEGTGDPWFVRRTVATTEPAMETRIAANAIVHDIDCTAEEAAATPAGS